MASIRLHNGKILLVGGYIALADACCCGSGSGSGGAGGISKGCCQDLPATITATFVNQTFCPCCDGKTVTLTYNGTAWVGTGDFGCGQDITLTFAYSSVDVASPCSLFFSLSATFSNGCATPTMTGPNSSACEPIGPALPYNMSGISACCIPGGLATSVNVFITE